MKENKLGYLAILGLVLYIVFVSVACNDIKVNPTEEYYNPQVSIYGY